jgi:Xaa-Pro aminopeptidase
MSAHLRRRIQKAKTLLKQEGAAALLLSTPPVSRKSGDTSYAYRPDSNLFYLTGCEGKEFAIIISSERSQGILIANPENPHTTTWEGPQPNFKKLSRTLGLEFREVKDISAEAKCIIANHTKLYHQNTSGTLSWRIASEIQSSPYFSRANMPHTFCHADGLMENLRLYKDETEIKLIKQAAAITNHALHETVPFVTAKSQEKDIAATIEYLFRVQGGEPSFNTIVAAGPSAAVLHHEQQTRELRNGEMLLVDCGAALDNYAADITRVVPISGHFTAIQKEVYSIVLEAQKAAIKAVKPGVRFAKVYEAAAKVLTQGLVDLGVLKGKVSKLMKDGAHKTYFMHGIGHTLGLDVHDLGNLRAKGDGILKPGMVVTIEPGLYFSKKIRHINPCGIRIEDDVLVTSRGNEILSEGFPKEISEIEEMMNFS